MPAFPGKTALVTGGGTGIGLAISRRFAAEGASVVILGRRREPLEAAAAELDGIASGAGAGGSARAYHGVDVADEAGINRVFDDLASSGRTVDFLVNNAGVSGPVTCFAHASMAEFAEAVGIHLTGTFWTSARALPVMREGGKIVTVSTFFTEERPLEQRPYRFRSPYTAAQGAKNRLAEAMSWELTGRGIASIATNPGPVHSDRIYKTVYPKAAAEFMRVSGHGGMGPAETEAAAAAVLPLLGEGEEEVRRGLDAAAGRLGADAAALRGLLEKIESVAKKIQANTAGMIADGQFLSQDQVAETVLALCGDGMSRTLNGRVVPGDRVFYPVRPHVGGAPPGAHRPDLSGRTVVVSTDAPDGGCAAALARHAGACGAKAVCLVGPGVSGEARGAISSEFHSHEADLSDQGQVGRWLGAAAKMGPLAAAVHVTGDVPDVPSLTGLSRREWDGLVGRFVNTPAAVVQRALEAFAPGGGDDPRLFRGAAGAAVIVGPGLPSGRRGLGGARARAEVFRGALRPLAATVNQELSDVLGSRARLFLALPGTASGEPADPSRLEGAMDYFVSGAAADSSQVVFCVDEGRRAPS